VCDCYLPSFGTCTFPLSTSHTGQPPVFHLTRFKSCGFVGFTGFAGFVGFVWFVGFVGQSEVLSSANLRWTSYSSNIDFVQHVVVSASIVCYRENTIHGNNWQISFMRWMSCFAIYHQPCKSFCCVTEIICTNMLPVKHMPNCIVRFIMPLD